MKRWIPPLIVALIVHGVLFQMDSGWTRPSLSLIQQQAVTLSLVQPTAADMAARKRVPPLAARPLASVAPLAPLAPPEPPPKPSMHATPDPIPQTRSEPAPDESQPTEQPMVTEPDPPPTESADERLPTDQAAADTTHQKPPQTAVQSSVPLYHLNPAPDYPALARRRGYQGTVLLDVLVDRHGQVVEVRVAHSSGHAVLDRGALAGVREWRFEPARRLGQPVEMWVQVPVRFALQ